MFISHAHPMVCSPPALRDDSMQVLPKAYQFSFPFPWLAQVVDLLSDQRKEQHAAVFLYVQLAGESPKEGVRVELAQQVKEAAVGHSPVLWISKVGGLGRSLIG